MNITATIFFISDTTPKDIFKTTRHFRNNDGEFMGFSEHDKANRIKKNIPVIDDIFPIEAAEDTIRKMETGAQFGKIVLSV